MQKLDHIGAIAVPNFAQAVRACPNALGGEVSSLGDLPEHGMCIVFV